VELGDALAVGYTIYVRPILSDWVEGEPNGYIYWKLQADFSGDGKEYKTWRTEGYSMDEALEALLKALPPQRKRRVVKKSAKSVASSTSSLPKKKRVVIVGSSKRKR
jgi:hypothetical protein